MMSGDEPVGSRWHCDAAVNNERLERLTIQLPTATSGTSGSLSRHFRELQYHGCGTNDLNRVQHISSQQS
jgi:hypothetical protein